MTRAEPIQETFELLYRAWFHAVADRDLDFFERTLAPDWLYVDSAGQTRDKQSYISYVRDLPASVRLENPTLSVRPFEPLCLVHGRYEIRRDVPGLAPHVASRFTSVWQRADNGWRALVHQATTIQTCTGGPQS